MRVIPPSQKLTGYRRDDHTREEWPTYPERYTFFYDDPQQERGLAVAAARPLDRYLVGTIFVAKSPRKNTQVFAELWPDGKLHTLASDEVFSPQWYDHLGEVAGMVYIPVTALASMDLVLQPIGPDYRWVSSTYPFPESQKMVFARAFRDPWVQRIEQLVPQQDAYFEGERRTVVSSTSTPDGNIVVVSAAAASPVKARLFARHERVTVTSHLEVLLQVAN